MAVPSTPSLRVLQTPPLPSPSPATVASSSFVQGPPHGTEGADLLLCPSCGAAAGLTGMARSGGS